MPSRVYIFDSSKASQVKKLMEYDPYLDKSKSEEEISRLKEDKEANLIFARQDYRIKDGIAMDMDREKSYLYLSATEEFLVAGEEKLKKNIEGLQRADPETENKVIEIIETERHQSEQGLGAIFG